MENQRIKENRRAKFLSKLENKNKINNNENNIYPSFYYNNSNKSIINDYIANNQKKNSMKNFDCNQKFQNSPNNMNNTNYIQNNFLYNNIKNNQYQNIQGGQKINFNELFEKLEQLDYMINFQKFFKIIILIILTILHCLDYPPLNNCFVFKYTFIVLELSSLCFNKYYSEQKKKITDNTLSKNNNSNNESLELIDKIFEFINQNVKFLNFIFSLFIFLKDVVIDISIMLIINIIYFLMSCEE